MCEWREDSDGNWDTECNNAFVLIEGTPYQNNMQFCCYCGKGLLQVSYPHE